MTPSWQLTPIPGAKPSFVAASNSGWYASADTMFLHLNQGRNQGLVNDLILFTPTSIGPGTAVPSFTTIVSSGPVVSTNNVANNVFEVVPRITVGYRDTDGTAIEATYFGRNDWSGSSAIAANPASHPPVIHLQTPDSFLSDSASTSLSSTLHSFEVNFVELTGAGSPFEILGGMRYLRLSEQFQLRSAGVIHSNDDQSQYNVETTNDLYGIQLGLRWKRSLNRWSIVAVGKSGLYANDCAAHQALGYSQNGTPFIARDETTSRPTFSTMQEIGLNGTCQLANYCTLRAGYNLLVVTGLARATDQIDFTSNPIPSLNSHGTAFLHGPSAGIEFRY